MAEKTYRVPKTIGACADKLFRTRVKRLKLKKEMEEVEKEEKALKLHIINTLPKSKASGVAGKYARVTVITKEVPQVTDWAKFYKHLENTGNFDLMQRRLSAGAIQDRWDDGKKVPGVEPYNVVTLSLNKV